MTATLIAVIAMSPASSERNTCVDGVTWRYCFEHVPANKVPLHFTYDPSGAPVSGDVESAIRDAQSTWNALWPSATTRSCIALCYDGVNSGAPNTISWGSPASCAGASADAVAVACLHYSGALRIVRVDVILNASKLWTLSPDPVGGKVNALLADRFGGHAPNPFAANWYDVGSALTHELGHSLGLEDIGNVVKPFPYDLTDAAKYTQTMYRWYFPGTDSKRTPEQGDITALELAADASSRDRA